MCFPALFSYICLSIIKCIHLMKLRVLYALSCAWGLLSCSSIQTITFDQLSPAQVSLPEQVRTVAVVNNMPSVPEPRPDLLTFGVLDGEGKTAAEALAGALADSRYFNQVVICDSALNDAAADGGGFRQLSHRDVVALTEKLGVDAIVSLDRIFVENEKKEMVYPGMPDPWPYLQTKITPVLNVYSPVRERPLFTVSLTDSIECDWDRLPSDKQLLEDVSHISAGLLGRRLVPYWSQTERLYFAGGCVEMRDAAVSVGEGDWATACEEWLGLYNRRKSGKMKGRAAFNLALGAEMRGDFEEAKSWLEKAGKHMPEGSDEEKAWGFYTVQLEKRIKEFFYLQAQMGRFNDNLER